jgi:hypothetical protein
MTHIRLPEVAAKSAEFDPNATQLKQRDGLMRIAVSYIFNSRNVCCSII